MGKLMGRHTARDDERLRSSLHDAAEAYQPDRQAISTRVAQGRAADRDKSQRRVTLGLRPAGAALAVVGVLVASGVAVRAAADDDHNLAVAPPPAVPAPALTGEASSPDPAGTAGSREPVGTTGSPAPGGSAGSPGTQPGTQPGTPPGTQPATSRPAGGVSWLDVAGGTGKDSVATWSEKNVTLHNTSPIVRLKVTITVPMSAGLAEAGKFTTVPNSDVTMTVARTPEGLIYSYELRDGATLIPGKYTFAAQFAHGSGRPAAKDSYLIQAATKTATAEQTGAFA
jgi:hypothetical protein